MENELPRPVQVPLIGIVSLHAALAALIGFGTLTCTGWAVESNNKALLGIRLAGYLVSSGGAVIALVKRHYLASSCLLVAAGLLYMWLETGWMFVQPVFSQPSKFAMLPLGIALLVLLAPHSPTLRQQGPGNAAT
jgi:hypothetical protein